MKLFKRSMQVLVLAVALSASAVLLMGIWKGKTQKEQQMTTVTDASEAEMKLTDMEYTEMQKGRRIWNLKAAEAKYFQDDQKTALSRVELVFFLENGEEIHLQSQHGILYAGSKDIELWGQVHAAFPQDYELTTERARYRHSDNEISSDASILVTGPDMKLAGMKWRYAIPERRAFLEGQIQATLIVDSSQEN